MWNPASPLAKKLRRSVGGVALVALALTPFMVSEKAGPSVVLASASDAISMMTKSELDGLTKITVLGETPALLEDTLIYAEKPGGEGEIIGVLRVVDGQLYASLPEGKASSGELRWYASVRTLGDGMQLVLGGEGMAEEADNLKDTILPAAKRELLTPMENRLRAEFDVLLEEMLANESGEFETIIAKLGESLEPEMETLSNRLVETAWDKVGVWGVAEGLWRQGSSALGSAAKGAWNAAKSLFGKGSDEEGGEGPDFLSDERKKELRVALQADINKFWADNGEKIMLKGREIVGSRSDFLNRIEERFGARFAQVVEETLRERAHLLESVVVNYANDMGKRKLVTEAGAPRLKLAYAIRSGSGLTARPLVVFIPHAEGTTEGSGIVLRPLYANGGAN